jgi:hypothetical protein
MGQLLQARFVQLPRGEREKVLCAMIRVNYATTWPGDFELLRGFLPPVEHGKIAEGQLETLISLLTLYAEEPTQPGAKVGEVGDTTADFTVTEKDIKVAGLTPLPRVAELPPSNASRQS